MIEDGDGDAASRPTTREIIELDPTEAMRLLATISYGRVVFTQDALPAIRLVNHLLDNGRVIIRTRLTTKVSAALRSTPAGFVVAYQADSLDLQRKQGWSVVLIGIAHTVTDPGEVSRYEQLLHPWVNKADTALSIQPQVVTGIRIIAGGANTDRNSH